MATALLTRLTRSPLLGATGLLAGLTVFITWPQALHLSSQIAGHDDGLFSIWRLAWIAHALPGGSHLFDANIFYPHTRTLAFSDATFLEGLIAAPFLWLGLNQVLVYNLLLLTGIVTSGIGMFVLVRYLTGRVSSALIAAAVFTVAPYRIEHFMHLELQWTMWMPLSIWALHRTFDEGTPKWGALTGVFLWLQFISCVYYGAYLCIIVAALALMLAAIRPRQAARAVLPLGLGAILVAALTLPYALPYIANARTLGPRTTGDVLSFSADWLSYATAPGPNWWWGWSGAGIEGNERHLFPGLIPPTLAILGLLRRPRQMAWLYLALMGLAVTLSFGLNGPLYRWLYTHISAFQGFRAPARFAILAWCASSVLAGFGVEWLLRSTTARTARVTLLAALLVALCVEAGSAPLPLVGQSTVVPPIYQFLKNTPPTVIIELPQLDYNPTYMFWSTYHWQSLVNGYSGYKPADSLDTLALMDTLPDDESIQRLQELNVHFILLHQAFYRQDDYSELLAAMASRPELIPSGQYRDWVGGNTQIFELQPQRR
ncbi:MAG TPA: hypothetical protein VGH34_13775 [Vicinamibacterales bacterium]